MSALEHLRQALGALKLYRLTGTSLVDWELESYAAAFAPVEEALHRLLADAFLESCGPQALARWERLLQLPARAGLAEETRRHMVIRMLSITPADQNRAGILRSLEAVGLEAQLEEHPPQGALVLRSATVLGSYENLDSLKRTVYGMLPAHLEAVFDIGVLTWEMWDGFDLTCGELDARDMTWQWFDLYGEQLGAKEKE